jgi:preprotein translocase subunit SecY
MLMMKISKAEDPFGNFSKYSKFMYFEDFVIFVYFIGTLITSSTQSTYQINNSQFIDPEQLFRKNILMNIMDSHTYKFAVKNTL